MPARTPGETAQLEYLLNLGKSVGQLNNSERSVYEKKGRDADAVAKAAPAAAPQQSVGDWAAANADRILAERNPAAARRQADGR